MDGITALLAPLRSRITRPDSATTPLAIPRSSIIKLPLRIPRLVISRSRVMTRVEAALPITTRQLALRRSQITLLVVRTQPWVQGQDQTSSLASITLTSATSLVPSTARRRKRYHPHRRHLERERGRVLQPATSVVSANNPQPVGANVVVVTLNLDNDQLGYDAGAARSGSAPAAPNRNAPQPRVRPQPGNHAALTQKVEQLQATVTQQQATVAQQQKQIETLTTQLREQAAQIQKVSAQLEMVRPTPRVVENR